MSDPIATLRAMASQVEITHPSTPGSPIPTRSSGRADLDGAREMRVQKGHLGSPEPFPALERAVARLDPSALFSGSGLRTAAEELRRAARFRGFRRALLSLFAEVESLGLEPRAFATSLRRAASALGARTATRASHARLALA